MLVDSFVKGAESAGIENQMEGVQNTTMKKEKLLLPILVLVLALMAVSYTHLTLPTICSV